MLPSANRLKLSKKSKRDLGGKKVTSQEFVLIAKAKEGIFRLGVSVSKKVAPRAVDRNRIKRLITESLRNQSVYSGDLIIIVKKNIAGFKKDQVEDKLIKLIKKLI